MLFVRVVAFARDRPGAEPPQGWRRSSRGARGLCRHAALSPSRPPRFCGLPLRVWPANRAAGRAALGGRLAAPTGAPIGGEPRRTRCSGVVFDAEACVDSTQLSTIWSTNDNVVGRFKPLCSALSPPVAREESRVQMIKPYTKRVLLADCAGVCPDPTAEVTR